MYHKNIPYHERSFVLQPFRRFSEIFFVSNRKSYDLERGAGEQLIFRFEISKSEVLADYSRRLVESHLSFFFVRASIYVLGGTHAQAHFEVMQEKEQLMKNY